jgi:hypothetical protein
MLKKEETSFRTEFLHNNQHYGMVGDLSLAKISGVSFLQLVTENAKDLAVSRFKNISKNQVCQCSSTSSWTNWEWVIHIQLTAQQQQMLLWNIYLLEDLEFDEET